MTNYVSTKWALPLTIIIVEPAKTEPERDERAHAVWDCLMQEAYRIWGHATGKGFY